ncbi:MBOAT family O-acyltransferase [Pedobacter mucosus]|uniref:MBOAT family O-acyltransferase n=1 Tax=Pedobacter mucosus TaxID=2895286 RepID=UPI001EE49D19|nr:MBOAT family O-acyltransferase [Pedobacter mucosus]UKT63241.1 MBOAT family protein [Pedobacter mucosus]
MAFVPVYILILGFTIIIDYFAGIYIERSSGRQRKSLLIVSLIANIGILVIFKYFNFLNLNFTDLLQNFNYKNPVPYLSILLPIGLSFHTFQAMSYTIEVYRGNQKAERHFGIYSLYVMFYPQLVAGPIERPQNLLYQFHKEHKFDYDLMTSGLRLMAWGLFKKVVIADRLAILVSQVFDHPSYYNSLGLIIATLFFSFQIYCDFSGYSDIAIGAARTMGFKLMRNFNMPYQSKSIDEFWKRWHISLSTWFKDYLYIPLGGNRVKIPRWYLNLFIVFLMSGVWHGANWTFIVWGALHGFYLVFGLLTKNIRSKFNEYTRIDKIPLLATITTFMLVAFAWIFFRAQSISSAIYIIKNIFLGLTHIPSQVGQTIQDFSDAGIVKTDLLVSFALIVFLELVHYLQKNKNIYQKILSYPFYYRWSAYYILLLTIILLGVFDNSQFIYFQF